MGALLGRLAEVVARWPRRVVAAAVVLVATLGVAAVAAGGSFSDDYAVPGTESQRAADLLRDRFPAMAGDDATVVLAARRLPHGSIATALARVAEQPHVVRVDRPVIALSTPSPSQPAGPRASREGGSAAAGGRAPRERGSAASGAGLRIARITVRYDAGALGGAPRARLAKALAPLERAGVEVSMRGPVIDAGDAPSPPVAEILGLVAAVLVLTLLFRSLVAMTLTLLAALFGLAGGMLLVLLASAGVQVPTVAPTLATMLGLGAGIDYALFVVARHRERLAAGDAPGAAAARANATSGRAVVAAGAIVVIAISGLLAAGIPFVGRMGLMAAVVVAAIAVATVTVLPAALAWSGRRLTPRAGVAGGDVFGRLARAVAKHPLVAALTAGAALLVLATPLGMLRLGQPDDGSRGAQTTQRRAYDRIAQGFGAGANAPLLVAVALPRGGEPVLARLHRALAADPGVAAVGPATLSPLGAAAALTVLPRFAPQDARTERLVERLRTDVVPRATAGTAARVHIGGATAALLDQADRVASRLPWFIGVVVAISVILLAFAFRSVWVPVVSAAMNLLSIGAAYGVVVAVFQWGWGAQLVGLDATVPIVSFIPLFMFAVLFGLSMDYNVFLQSRIAEEHRRGAPARESVVRGLAATSHVVTAAGAIMVAVFLGFVTDGDTIVKMVGLGLATAILVDVTVVRMVLMPAVMTLLGDRAWWLPPRPRLPAPLPAVLRRAARAARRGGPAGAP